MRLNGVPSGLLTQNGHKPPQPLRLGIIGFGNIGRQHFQAANSLAQVDLVALADTGPYGDSESLADIAVYSRWDELLRHPGLDAVSICVPHHLHAPISLAGLEAGKHVLVEKPLALDSIQGRELIDAAAHNDLTLMVEMTHRFYPPLLEAREIIQSGRLGRIYAIEDRIIEPVSSQLVAWMQDSKTAGGGVALTNGVHMLDRIAMVADQTLCFRAGSVGYGAGLGDIEDTATMLLTLADGTPIQLLAAWPRGIACGGSTSDDELTIYGTEATLRVWAWRGWRLEPLDGKTPAQEKLCYPPETDVAARVQIGVRDAITEFAAAVRDRRAPRPAAEAALRAQMLAEELYAFVGSRRDS